MNGCEYLLHTGEKAAEDANGNFLANVDLVCPAGKEVIYHLYKDAAHKELLCSLDEPAMMAHKQITIQNSGTSPDSVTTTIDFSDTANGSGGVCGGAGQTVRHHGILHLAAKILGVLVALKAIHGP
jgi:hypothetical protein